MRGRSIAVAQYIYTTGMYIVYPILNPTSVRFDYQIRIDYVTTRVHVQSSNRGTVPASCADTSARNRGTVPGVSDEISELARIRSAD